jgi:myo-inositol 2-dehydrogenase/D-chiro-inositol 1-dehydrogenase
MESPVKKAFGRKVSRRDFLGSAGAGLVIIKPRLVRGTSANSAVRLGLLGCGARGHAVATSMVRNNNARIIALGDLFEDRLDEAKRHFDALAGSQEFAAIERAQMFQGPSAFVRIVASNEVDGIIIATPSYFHPQHLEAVVAAGKHVYCEKPSGIDVPGAQRVLEAGRKAHGRLSLAVGLEVRCAPPYAELVRRIQGGALGEIACVQGYYYAPPLGLPDWPSASAFERKIRRFFYWLELSGGILVDQGIHPLDIINWALQMHPLNATGTGGRKVRQDEGNCWDHYNLTYGYPNGVHLTFSSTQFDRGWWDVCTRFFGSKGVAEAHYAGPVAIYGDNAWTGQSGDQPAEFSKTGSFSDNLKYADPEKGKSFIQSIVTGQLLNESSQGVEATLTTILGRMAAVSGREVTWEEMLRSGEVLDPKIDLNNLA